jgi:hypothetical protein
MEDITEILAFEVKKEMADRYFGSRKRIEDDTAAYTRRLTISSLELENKIGYTLIRLYILLHGKTLISSFAALVGLPRDLFYDPYILESPTIRKRVFAGQQCRGFTRKQRFRNLFLDTYDNLTQLVEEYREALEELTEEEETIREQINLFYRKNDIDTILSFIRRLDSPDANILTTLQPAEGAGPTRILADQMRLHPPLPTCEILPTMPALPGRKQIQPQLLQLIKEAMSEAGDIDLKSLTRRTD